MLLEFKVVMPNLNSMQTELIKSIRDEIQTWHLYYTKL
jgi:hypothetical protein